MSRDVTVNIKNNLVLKFATSTTSYTSRLTFLSFLPKKNIHERMLAADGRNRSIKFPSQVLLQAVQMKQRFFS